VLRRQWLTETGPFDESTIYAGELDLWFRLAHSCSALYWNHVGHSCRHDSAAHPCEPHAQTDDRIAVLQREKRRWSDRAVRRQLDRLIAQNLAAMGYEQRLHRRRIRSIAMFAYAFATYPDVRWLRGMLGSIRS